MIITHLRLVRLGQDSASLNPSLGQDLPSLNPSLGQDLASLNPVSNGQKKGQPNNQFRMPPASFSSTPGKLPKSNAKIVARCEIFLNSKISLEFF